MEPKITIKTKERRSTLAEPRREYEYAWAVVETDKQTIEMGFSKYDKESDWKLDTMFNDGLPVFNHGEGDRCCTKQKASDILLEAIEEAQYT